MNDDLVVIACSLLVLVAAWSDDLTHRIPNALTGSGMLVGLVLASLPHGHGFGHALMALSVGLLVWMPFYFLRLLGAGDVKLLAAVGTFVGWPGVLYVAALSGLAGGILACAMSASRDNFSQLGFKLHGSFKRLRLALMRGQRPERLEPEAMRLPFATAVACASFMVLYFQHGPL